MTWEAAYEAAGRLELWLRYGNPRPNPVSNEGRKFENDLQLVCAELRAGYEAARPAEGEWVLVPREPTEAMLRAGFNAQFGEPDPNPQWMYERCTWAAMLSASPRPPSAEREALVAEAKHLRTLVIGSNPERAYQPVPMMLDRLVAALERPS